MGLSLNVLGEFALRDGAGAALSLPTRKTRALLGYLAVNVGRPQQRDRLMALLWSDRGERQARHSLNQALASLRKLGNEQGVTLFEGDGERVTLRSDVMDIDLVTFRALLADDPAQAAALYEGRFLDGLSVPDPAFDEWLTATRSEFHNLACDALERAAELASGDGDAPQAIELTRRLVALDPLREDGHRRLMQLLYESGDRTGALRQYQACADILKKELQVEPDAATKVLFEDIRRNATSAKAPETPSPTPEPASTDAPPSLPDKPSIAVLPFVNLSGDPEQEIFAEGMTEDIITGLSHIRWLVVIARSSTFAYRGKSPDVRRVGRDLGVRYVLEGGIRKRTNQIRVTAQLIDATLGSHVWAQTYNRNFEDIFEIQDEITDAIVGALAPQIDRMERLRAKRKPPESLDAWTQYQLALSAYYTGTLDGLTSAIKMFDRAAEMDPSFAAAYTMGAASRNRLVINYGVEESDSLLEEARKKLSIALDLDPEDATCHCIKGISYSLQAEFDLAIGSLAKAVELNPSSAEAHYFSASVLYRAGRPEQAIAMVDRAIRLSPNDARIGAFRVYRADCLFDLEKYDACADWARQAIHSANPRARAYVTLAAALVFLERDDEAKTVLEELKSQFPNFSFASDLHSRRARAVGRERLVKALDQVGYPE